MKRAGRAVPRGKVPDNVWGEFPRVCDNFREQVKGHCCQTPQALCERVIRATNRPGGLVLDPMCGTGTACAAAAGLGRRLLGVESSAQTAEKARQRLSRRRQGAAAG